MSLRTALLNRVGLLPLAILLFLFLVGNAIAYTLISLFPILVGNFAIFQLYAFFFAQAGIYCVLGGILGRAWISSFLIGAVCAVLATLAFCFYIGEVEVSTLIFGLVPLLLFCGCLPFLLLRSWFGWHLHRNTEPFAEPYSLRMGDIFLATTVVAGVVAMAMTSFSFATDGSEGIVQLVMFAVFATLGSAVAVVPVTIMYFRASTRRNRALVLIGFGLSGLMAWTGIIALVGLWSHFDVLATLWFALPPVATASVLFSVGLIVLRASGYRWVVVQPSTQSAPTVDTLSHFEQPALHCRYRRRNLIATAGIIAGSIVLSITISAINQVRASLAKTYAELNGKLAADGGYLEHNGHQPIALKVANSATDSTLPDLSQLTELGKISFSGSKVTAEALKSISILESLGDIDLSYTTLDDSAVSLLNSSGTLARLSLAGTRVTINGIRSVVGSGHFNKLDIGNLNIDDDSLAQLSVLGLNELVLSGNPITDVSMRQVATVRILDLSETKCVGTGFGQLTNTVSLVLDGTSVDDAAIKQLLSSNKVLARLSLRNTQVTNAILPALQQSPCLTELEIGEGQITRDGLLAVAFAPTERFALNSKKFDASVFADWHPSVRRLDMSDSGVSDDDVVNLKNVRGLTELSLAHCNLSNACLPKLVALGVSKLDLTGTQITASAVVKLFPKTTVVYLSAEQCQPEQLAAPDPVSSLRIGARMKLDSGNF